MMVERGTWLVPTLTSGDTTEALERREGAARGAGEAAHGRASEFDAFRLAAEAGVKVAMGTDRPVALHG